MLCYKSLHVLQALEKKMGPISPLRTLKVFYLGDNKQRAMYDARVSCANEVERWIIETLTTNYGQNSVTEELQKYFQVSRE